MNIEEAIKQCEELINDFKVGNGLEERVNATDVQAIETVLKELKDNQADLTTVYIKGVCDEKSKWRDKIKKKIEELKYESWYIKDCKFNKLQEKIYNSGILFGKNIVLQELLKENKDVN